MKRRSVIRASYVLQFHDGVYLVMLIGLLEGYFVPLHNFHLTPTTFEQKVGAAYSFYFIPVPEISVVFCGGRPWVTCLFVGCLASQQHASISHGRISDNFTCCHTEIEVADQTFHLTQSQYADT